MTHRRTPIQLRRSAESVETIGRLDHRYRPTRIAVRWVGQQTITEWVLTDDGEYEPVLVNKGAES